MIFFEKENKDSYQQMVILMIIYLVLFCLFYGVSSSVKAENVGVIGQTYPILEEDFLDFIQHRISEMKSNGQWEAQKKHFQNEVKAHADRPSAVKNISKTTQEKSWRYDPSVIVPYDMKDTQGHVFAKAGTTMNPLKMISLHHVLVFYDGDDVEQVAWAKRINHEYSGKIKLILVNGSVKDQQNIFHKAIYFDQQGRLTTRFHITHVPALMAQEGLYLRISERVPT